MLCWYDRSNGRGRVQIALLMGMIGPDAALHGIYRKVVRFTQGCSFSATSLITVKVI